MTRELTQEDFQEWAKEFPEVKVFVGYGAHELDDYRFAIELEYGSKLKDAYFLEDKSNLYDTVLKWLESKEQPKKWEDVKVGDTLTLASDGSRVRVSDVLNVPLFPRVITLENCHQSQHFYPHMFKEFQEEPKICSCGNPSNTMHSTIPPKCGSCGELLHDPILYENEPTPEEPIIENELVRGSNTNLADFPIAKKPIVSGDLHMKPQSIYTQEYIDNTEYFMCDEPLKGWGLTKIGWLECVLYSKDVRTKPDFPFEVLEPVNGLRGFEKFTLTNPNKPKEQEIMDAENKTDLSEAMEIVISELSKDKEEGSYYHGWQSNIAMAVYDSLPKGLTEYFYDSINKCCNAGAKEFLDRLIGQPELPKVETKEQEYKPFVKLTEEQQLFFREKAFTNGIGGIKTVTNIMGMFIFFGKEEMQVTEMFKDNWRYYSPEEKAWVKFGEKVES